MTREEAIKVLSSYDVNGVWADVDGKPYNAEEQAEAFDMAIEALLTPPISQRSMYQAGYRQGREEALNREPSEDGTLEVKVEDATKIGRVLISDDEHRGGLYYPDEDEPKGDLISRTEAYIRIAELSRDLLNDDCINLGNACDYLRTIRELPSADRPKDGDLISRADAIEALGEEPLVWCDEDYEIAERSQWRDDVEAIKSVPSADRPRGEWTLLTEERPVDGYEIIATVYWPRDGDSIIAIGHIDRFDNWHLYNPTEGALIKGFEVIAWKTLPEPYKESDTK